MKKDKKSNNFFKNFCKKYFSLYNALTLNICTIMWNFLKNFQNPQIYQTIFLMIILNLGILFFGLHLDYTKFTIIFLSTLLLDIIFGWIRFWKPRFPFSGVNAWFGISFFLRTDILVLYFLAAFLAISSKYLFQYKDRHFFNPSNFWVFVMLVLFPNLTWTNPLQWTSNFSFWWQVWLMYILIFFLWIMIVYVVRKTLQKNLLYVIIPFLVLHLLLYFLVAPTETSVTFWQWYTPSFFIFVFFMLTDPMILPIKNISKIGLAVNIAILPYILQFFINENYVHLAALFIMTCMIPIGRYIEHKNPEKSNEVPRKE